MKKSELYRLAQISVMRDVLTDNETKLDIIRELQDKESTALFIEREEQVKCQE